MDVIQKDDVTFTMPGIFDLEEDDSNILRMPFNPADYGERNGVLRTCKICRKEFPQGEMKELGAHEDDPDGIEGPGKIWNKSLFYCRGCWFSNPISNAGNWVA